MLNTGHRHPKVMAAVAEQLSHFSHTCFQVTPYENYIELAERLTGLETRVTILGHVQRGGTPVAYDRILATRFGVGALRAVAAGRSGVMVALRGTEIIEVPLGEALAKPRLLDPELYETAALFFG